MLVVLASGPVLGERLTPRRIVAALLGFAGVAVVGLHQSAEASAGGVLLLLGASVSWSAGALITSASDEPIVAARRRPAPRRRAAARSTVAAVSEPFPTLSAKLVSCVVFAGVCGSAMAWMLWSALLRRGEASVVSTWLFAVPVLAAALGVVFLDEPLSLALSSASRSSRSRSGLRLCRRRATARGPRRQPARRSRPPAARPGRLLGLIYGVGAGYCWVAR